VPQPVDKYKPLNTVLLVTGNYTELVTGAYRRRL